VIHYITLRVSAHSTEEKSRVRNALDFFLMNSVGKGVCTSTDDMVETLDVDGHYKNPITIYSARITRRSDCLVFTRFIRANMQLHDLDKLHSEMPERLDDNQVFHLRFDKQAAYLNRVELSSSSDAIVVKIKIATYPKNREQAGRIVEGLFG